MKENAGIILKIEVKKDKVFLAILIIRKEVAKIISKSKRMIAFVGNNFISSILIIFFYLYNIYL